MSAAAIFTRRIMGMDYRVWLVMPAIWLVSLALLGYKYINNKSCAPASIYIDGKKEEPAVRFINQRIKFEIQTEGAAKIVWDFKDGTDGEPDIYRTGPAVYHTFSKEGPYKVVVVVNGTCTYEQDIMVKSRDITNQGRPKIGIFPYPEKPKYSVGDMITFESEEINIRPMSYEWNVLETGDIQREALATFTFNNAGKYTVQLIINNDPSTVTTKRIEVVADTPLMPNTPDNPVSIDKGPDVGSLPQLVPQPEKLPDIKGTADSTKDTKGTTNGAAPPKPKPREVDPEAFKALLQSVVNEEGKELEDLYEFLDYKGSTMVEVNGDKNAAIQLKEFCKTMRDKKKNKRKIETLSFIKDNNNSVQRIQVKVPGKGFWDWLPFN